MSETASHTPMVELAGVTKRFGRFVAVDDVTLGVRRGEFLTLLGPSGCGKTTMLRMISGFERPTAGRVLLDGRDVTDLPPYRRAVNQVFQSYALFPHLTVRQNVEFGPKTQKLPRTEIRQRVEEALRVVALEGLEQRRPAELSGGQRQRVALARAIVNRPKVLLLDEPLSALDAKLRHDLRLELKQLQHRLGITFVFVTHDQDEALTMSDRIAVVNAGRIEQLGPPQEIYHRPRTKFVATFVGRTNLIEGQVRSTTAGGVEIVTEDGAAFVAATAGTPGEKMTLSVRPESVRISHERPDGVNAFEGVVEACIFRGAVGELLVRAGPRVWNVLAAGPGALERLPSRGERVWCGVRAEDLARVDP